MKKVLSLLTAFVLLTGCSLTEEMDNTPTKKVENYLSSYQTLDENVLSDLNDIVEEEITFTDSQKESYKDILKKHYQDLTYTVKEETVNGDTATVEVEVEVTDYSKKLIESEGYLTTNKDEFQDEEGNYSEEKYNDYRLGLLKDTDEKVKYTILFNLTKTDDEWTIDDLSDEDQQKLLGIYRS